MSFNSVVAFICAVVIANPVFAETPLNADPSVKYVGTQACVECHKDQHQTYLLTAHSRSSEPVDLAKEDVPAKFTHQASGFQYEVYRKDDSMYHREIIRDNDGEVLATTDREIVYTVGSGAHGKSYVYQDGPFRGQSPISWYKSQQEWAMSPTYDLPFHSSFGRKLTSECFFCHVSAVDIKAGNPNDFTITEDAIGCERCHGPGELHVARYRQPAVTGIDNTIVNPADLPRELSESICQQCHLQAAGKVLVSNQQEWNYRPGLRLADFRVDYQYQVDNGQMKIVGHVEQLHQSECYQQTEDLTCITCHNPHDSTPPEDRIRFYRSVCQKCHQQNSCGELRSTRMTVARNDCSQCHMPKKETPIPHTALTHHKIGIHRQSAVGNETVQGLTAVLNTSHLSPLERQRCEAIAKFQVMQEQQANPNFQNFGIEAAQSLIQVKNAGKADGEANTVLALLARSQGQNAIAKDIATEVVAKESQPSRAKIESLRILAQSAYQNREFETAAKHYRDLTQYQSEPFDYFQLGVAEQNSGNSDRAVTALEKAIDLSPIYIDAIQVLAAIKQSLGEEEESRRYTELAEKHQARMRRIMESVNGDGSDK